MSCCFEAEAAYHNGHDAGVIGEREAIVEWLREQAAKATKRADEYLSAGKSQDFVALLIHSAECFETAAFAVEARGDEKARSGA